MADIGSDLIALHESKNFGLEVITDNVITAPAANTPYSWVRIFDAGIDPADLTDTDTQILILQVQLLYPLGTSDLALSAKAAEILDGYSFNERITGTGYHGMVTKKTKFSGEAEGGWYSMVLRINFLFYIDRV